MRRFWLCASILGVALVAVVGCRAKAALPFRAVELVSGLAAIGVNEPIVIRFDRPLDPTPPSGRAVLVRDSENNVIPVRLRPSGPYLFVEPRGPILDWPKTSELSLQIIVPNPVSEIRDWDGGHLREGFHRRVPLSKTRLTLPGTLELLESSPTDNAKGIAFDPDVERQFHVVLSFNASLDPLSLSSGIQIINRDLEVVLEDVDRRVDPEDPSTVLVSPFTHGMQFSGNTRYEIWITQDLRSTSGWSPKARRKIAFTTAAGAQSLIQVGFSRREDFDPRSQAEFTKDGILRPRPLRHASVPRLGADGPTALHEDRIMAERDGVPRVFGAEPSRSQILIPESWILPPNLDEVERPRRVLIKSVNLYTPNPVPRGAVMLNPEIHLGYLGRRRDRQDEGLSDRVDLNVEDDRRMTLERANAASVGRWPLSSEMTRPTAAGESTHRFIRLEFASPFVYDTHRGDLVLTIQHFGVTTDGLVPAGGLNVSVVGYLRGEAKRVDAQNPCHLLMEIADVESESNRRRVRLSFQPYLSVEAIWYPPIITRWYEAVGAKQPRFFRRSGPTSTDAPFEEKDYSVTFQGGVQALDAAGEFLRDAAGASVISETGTFENLPPQNGSRAIRLRIEFNPESAVVGGRPPEIEYILVGYKDL